MNKIKIGLVVDFNNYKDYFNRFSKKNPDKIIEFHVLEKDLANDFPAKISEIKKFLKKNNIKDVSFHAPIRIMQSVLFEEESPSLDDDKKKVYLMLDVLKKLSTELNQEILLVVHQGIKGPKGFFDNMTDKEVDEYREDKLRQAEKGYIMLLEYVQDSKLLPSFENSPPLCAESPDEHFMDIAFEDIELRLKNTGRFVFDISHAALGVEYFKQDKVKLPALESVRRKYKGVPESLQSLENYVKKAGKNTVWIHLNDANGFSGENEGHVIGVKGSVIDFNKLIKAIKKEVRAPKAVLEIINAHKDYDLIEQSLINFIKLI